MEFVSLQKAVDRVANIPDTVESGQLNLRDLEKTLAVRIQVGGVDKIGKSGRLRR